MEFGAGRVCVFGGLSTGEVTSLFFPTIGFGRRWMLFLPGTSAKALGGRQIRPRVVFSLPQSGARVLNPI